MSGSASGEAPRSCVVLVGGANVDVLGVPDGPLVAADSNPGRIEFSAGGVARNVAENLARLGVQTHLITAIGDDANGRFLSEDCERVGIDLSGSLVLDDVPSSLYVALLDEHGDMAVALNDMRALERLTREVLAERLAMLQDASLVVIDANLPSDTLLWLAESVETPLLLDPISVAKAPRAVGILPRLSVLHCNAMEASALLRREVAGPEDALAAAGEFAALGVERAFITLGPRGTAAADRSEAFLLEAAPAPLVNATGAGDAFTAGVAFARLAAMTLRESAEFGRAMAVLAMGSHRTVSEDVSLRTVDRLIEENRR